MKIPFKFQKIVGALLLMPFIIVFDNGAQAIGPDDFREEAILNIPSKPTSYNELIDAFEGKLREKPRAHFKKYFSLMFSNAFPKPIHPDATILEGWRCLYRKMAYAQTLEGDNEVEVLQMEGMNELLSLHKKLLVQFNPEAIHEIQGFPCESCAKSARKQFIPSANDSN